MDHCFSTMQLCASPMPNLEISWRISRDFSVANFTGTTGDNPWNPALHDEKRAAYCPTHSRFAVWICDLGWIEWVYNGLNVSTWATWFQIWGQCRSVATDHSLADHTVGYLQWKRESFRKMGVWKWLFLSVWSLGGSFLLQLVRCAKSVAARCWRQIFVKTLESPLFHPICSREHPEEQNSHWIVKGNTPHQRENRRTWWLHLVPQRFGHLFPCMERIFLGRVLKESTVVRIFLRLIYGWLIFGDILIFFVWANGSSSFEGVLFGLLVKHGGGTVMLCCMTQRWKRFRMQLHFQSVGRCFN